MIRPYTSTIKIVGMGRAFYCVVHHRLASENKLGMKEIRVTLPNSLG